MSLIKVYLMNGKHVDVAVKKEAKAVAEEIAETGVWSDDRGEKVLYPVHQIVRVRICQDKPKEKAKEEAPE